MPCKFVPRSCYSVLFLLFFLSFASLVAVPVLALDADDDGGGTIPVDEEDGLWSRVEMAIAMIRTSNIPSCAGNCAGGARGSKARLIFPDGFLDLVQEKLGDEIGKAYFVVYSENEVIPGYQYINFDATNMKSRKDGRFYFERSSNQGIVEGKMCYPLTYVLDHGVVDAPPAFILKGVVFENGDSSQHLMLKPKKEPRATSTGNNILSCGGPFDTQPVIPWDDNCELMLPNELTAPVFSEPQPSAFIEPVTVQHRMVYGYPMFMSVVIAAGSPWRHRMQSSQSCFCSNLGRFSPCCHDTVFQPCRIVP